MKPITERKGVEQVVPHKNGRPRKHESTVTTYEATEDQANLQPIGVVKRLSQAKTVAALQVDAMSRQDVAEAAEAAGPVYVHKVYEDPNSSGSKKNVERPAFEQAVLNLMAGVIMGLAVLDIDRLTRRHLVLEQLIDFYEDHPGLFWYCDDPTVDLRTPEGRAVARAKVNEAAGYSAAVTLKVSRRHEQSRRAGVMVGTRGYGYKTDGTLMPGEHEVVQLLADAKDSGANMTDFIAGLTAQGIMGKTGSPFTHRTVKGILTSPRVAGYRVDSSKPDGMARDANGQPVKGNQPAILDVAQWERIRGLYAGNEVDDRYRKYLASEVLTCATCNGGMNGQYDKGVQRHRYRCQAKANCKLKATLHGPMTDDYVKELVELELAKDTPEVVQPEPWPGLGEFEALEARRVAKRAEKEAGVLDTFAWLDIDDNLATLIAQATQARRVWNQLHPMPTEQPRHELLETWRAAVEADDIPAMRRVVKAVLKRIVVTPGGDWSAERLTVIPQAQS
jgi:DNA invertase Pin-like site-specific DNA recombinase